MTEDNLTDLTPFLPKTLLDPGNLRQAELVLQSKRIPYRITKEGEMGRLWVPTAFSNSAITELNGFLNEQPVVTEKSPALGEGKGFEPILMAIAGWIFFHLFVHQAHHASWIPLGAAQKSEIIAGSWWRALTALTLHADAQHLLGNMLFGGFIFFWLSRMVGNGMVFFLALLSGFFGNLLNAYAQPIGHISIGASTAIFGTLGVLMGIRITLSRADLMRGVGIPLLTGAIMLGLFGAGSDPRTDVGAHIFGFFTGLPIGFLWFQIWKKHTSGIIEKNVFWGIFSLMTLVLAWGYAWATA
ncbi:MAG: rhomboid family intramembrane serine protease [Rhodothermia bacterium]|nr:rhomboid family intramembrane serine protease [Rhodothermia bacterium]